MHSIRLRGPWQLFADATTDAARRLEMPCAAGELFLFRHGVEQPAAPIAVARRFQRPTGLTPESQVTLVLDRLPTRIRYEGLGELLLRSITLNDRALEVQEHHSDGRREAEIDPPSIHRLEIGGHLLPSNVVRIEFDRHSVEGQTALPETAKPLWPKESLIDARLEIAGP